MTTYTNALIVYSSGALKKIGASDSIALDGDLEIGGNLTVEGTIVSKDATNVLIEDAFLDIGAGNTSTTNRALGFSFNVSAVTSSTQSGSKIFTAGVVATSAPTITIVGADWSSVYTADSIIQISNASVAENNGLFAVESVAFSTDTVLTLYGVGGTAVPAYAKFIQNQVTTAAAATATSTKVNLAVLGVSDGSSIKNSSGSAISVGSVVSAYYADALITDFNGTGSSTGYTALATGGSVTMQGAYDGGPSIVLTDTNDLTVSKPVSGTASIELEANKNSSITVEDADMTLALATSGYATASKDFGTVGSGTFDSVLDAQFSGLGGNDIRTRITALGSSELSVLSVGDSGGLLKVTTSASHGLTTGDSVFIKNVTFSAGNDPNGHWVVTVVDADEFTLDGSDSTAFVFTSGGKVRPGLLSGPALAVSALVDDSGDFKVTTTANHGLTTGDFVEIRGITYSSGFAVTSVDVSGGEFKITTSANHGLAGGEQVTISGVTYSSVSITGIVNSSGLFRVTTGAAHGLTTGDSVLISGVTYSAGNDPNGTWTITVVDSDEFTLDSGNATGFTYTSGGTAKSLEADANPNGTWTVTVVDADEFTLDGSAPTTFDAYVSGGTAVSVSAETIPNGYWEVTVVDENEFTLDASVPAFFNSYTSGGVVSPMIAVNTVGNNGGALQITTTKPHFLTTGDYVFIRGIVYSAGSPPPSNPNDQWQITVVSATQFTLDGSSSTNFTSYTSGGSVGGMFVAYNGPASSAQLDFTYQIKNGITTVGHIEATLNGQSISDISVVNSKYQVTTTTPHGIVNGQYVYISNVTYSGGEDPNNQWQVSGVTDYTFDLDGNYSPSGFSYTSGGDVLVLNYSGLMSVSTGGTSGSVLDDGDTFGYTNLAGGVGEGQTAIKRGSPVLYPGAGVSGSGAALFLDSPYGLTSSQHGAILYGSDTAALISRGDITLALAANSSQSVSMTLNADNYGAGDARISVRAKSRIQLEVQDTSGKAQMQVGSSFVNVQGSGDLQINAGSQPIAISTDGNNITLETYSSGSIGLDAASAVLIDGDSGVEINSSGSSIQIGNDGDNQTINIGSGGARTIKIGRASSPVIFAQSSTDSAPLGTLLPMASADGIATGNILYITNNSGTPKAVKADADGAGIIRELVGVALEGGPGSSVADKKVATIPGSIVPVLFNSGDLPTGDADIGLPVYLSTTAGEAGMTAPTSAARVYRVGILLDGSPVSGNIYKVLYLPAFVADLT